MLILENRYSLIVCCHIGKFVQKFFGDLRFVVDNAFRSSTTYKAIPVFKNSVRVMRGVAVLLLLFKLPILQWGNQASYLSLHFLKKTCIASELGTQTRTLEL